MSQQNRTTLKTYFETNDFPTEAQFINFIDSIVNILDDGILVGGEDNIVAFNGGGQANAYQLTKKHNRVTTQTNPGDSVKVPSGIAGMTCSVYNESGDFIDIFPFTGGFLQDELVNIAVSLGNDQTAFFACYATNRWSLIFSGTL